MSDSLSQRMWKLAGRPCPDIDPEPMPQPCCICGHPCEQGGPADDVVPKTESGRHHFASPWSEWACAGCAYVSKGRWKDQFRLWSVVYCEDGGLADHYTSVYEQWGDEVSYDVRLQPLVEQAEDRVQLTCKGDLREAMRLMCDPPDCAWAVSVADSGKKQVMRYAEVNHGSPWRVRFEDTDVACDAATWTDITWHAASLKLDGWSERDILTGETRQSKLYKMRDKIDGWLLHSEALGEHHHSRALELALFCMTRDTTDDIHRHAAGVRRRRDRPDIDTSRRRPDPVAAELHQGRGHQAAQALDVGAESAQDRGGEGQRLPPDGQRDVRPASDQGCDMEAPIQGDLFGGSVAG